VPLTIFHFSDSHGRVPVIPTSIEFDIIVCSGDFLPDRYVRKEEQIRYNLPWCMPASPERQEHWLRTQLDKVKAQARGKPWLFCPGNHDFYDPVPMLREAGVDAHNLADTVVTIGGIRFYGFPYCPWAGGGYNYELHPTAMEMKVGEVVDLLNEGAFDVLVAHCPPYKMLDLAKNGQLCGNPWMTKALLDLPPERLPKAYLCGHVHRAAGDGDFRGMYVSNAATKTRLIPVRWGD
jgi:Icc-related predicted phosphoesterase